MKKPASILILSLLLLNFMACSDTKSSTSQAEQETATPVKESPVPTSSLIEKAESEPDNVAISEKIETTTPPKIEEVVNKPKREVPINQTPKPVLTVNEPVKVEIEKAPKKEEVKKEMSKKAKEVKKKKEILKEKIEPPVAKETPEAHSVKHMLTHDQWDLLLEKHVSATGKVNYKGFKADISKLDAYLKSLQDNPIESKWSRNQKMAYWINAYNAFTVKMIVDNYPTSSITKLHGGKPWDVSWIKLGGKTYSLNNIENDILRPQYKDARIHFAVNCAARSCPPLLNQAWTSETLNRYFDKQAKAFINNTKYNKTSADKVEISKIFEWYAADFGDITEYLNKYSATKVKPGAKVTYMEYDWALNE